jgi:hypothetical protein
MEQDWSKAQLDLLLLTVTGRLSASERENPGESLNIGTYLMSLHRVR